jgi:arginyl-tRNA--protein-N-Asp/Glu arginylyltransferase
MSDSKYPETRVVHDRFEPCIYRPGQVARCPARVPKDTLDREQLDVLLNEGDQRVGGTVFRTDCPFCSACEPVRIDVNQFVLTKSQLRVVRRNTPLLRIEVGTPELSRKRVALWNRHRQARGLLTDHSRKDPVGYQEWLVDSCAETLEFRYWYGDRLAAVSILDRGTRSANSAYCYFDPRLSKMSLGVFSVLHEIEWCRANGIEWYYLGLWAADATALRYKTNYYPHERFVRGTWQRFTEPQEYPPQPDGRPEPTEADCQGDGEWMENAAVTDEEP